MCDKLDRKYKRRITAVLCGSGQTEGSCPGGLECDLGCVAGVSIPFFAAVDEGSASGPLGAQLVFSSTPGRLTGCRSTWSNSHAGCGGGAQPLVSLLSNLLIDLGGVDGMVVMREMIF